MCRSIKTLRAPYAQGVTHEDVLAAALQYVRTVSGYRMPPPADSAAFDAAVERVATATEDLLDRIQTPVAPASGLPVRQAGMQPA